MRFLVWYILPSLAVGLILWLWDVPAPAFGFCAAMLGIVFIGEYIIFAPGSPEGRKG